MISRAKIRYSIRPRMEVRSAFTEVPWMKLRLRRYFTFFNSRSRIFAVVLFKRLISCCARPRLFTSSIFRKDSVVAPANAVVSATMTFWIFLIFRLRTETSMPRMGIVMK